MICRTFSHRVLPELIARPLNSHTRQASVRKLASQGMPYRGRLLRQGIARGNDPPGLIPNFFTHRSSFCPPWVSRWYFLVALDDGDLEAQKGPKAARLKLRPEDTLGST